MANGCLWFLLDTWDFRMESRYGERLKLKLKLKDNDKLDF